TAVKWFLTKTGLHPGKPVFFNSAWLKTMYKKHPEFRNILRLYATSNAAVFPVPSHERNFSTQDNIIIITLLLVWAFMGMARRYDPLYQSSFYRYFLSHTFYVNDVATRKIRPSLSGYSILIQHCIAGGIIYY